MRLSCQELSAALSQKLLPLYLLQGDEPLQLTEAADLIRSRAKQAGFLTREILTVDSRFDWRQLAFTADSISIFADKKLIDLRIQTAKVSAEAGKAIQAYCQELPTDTLLLISSAKLDSATLKSKWIQTVDQRGAIVSSNLLEGQFLLQWLQQRLLRRGLHVESAGIKLLASRIEGNLLAAAQEVEKLYVLHGTGQLTTAMVENAVADSARFDVFKLTEAALAGQVNRVTRILQILQQEGTASTVILWAFSRDTRALIELKTTTYKDPIFRKWMIWDKRKQLINEALNRLSLTQLHQIMQLNTLADQQIKGQQAGNAWETLAKIGWLFCSVPVL
jgi:DNA polymerase-3 subunit delta